ncbi:hypothetical protein NC796_03100 [Aliifodinibius sp. S!AR15-10]|uniref:hypothetical protein n=1 Tax=Aliifodinibius sp. S!AR15-10 TaxID=2950437 RepID=UPI0028617ED0|nr:hypothetical protein [Aliifodinibius sp. S!AR15-10]MDR8390112.1 hypothetical protein [Aliifodinibius sp. S!AR15-10]
MKYFNTSTLTVSLFLLTVATLITACSNPASSGEEHEHTEPEGLQLVMNGETIIEFFDGQVTGNLTLTEGEETSLITVEFLNEEREHIHAEDLDEGYSLGWNIQNQDVIEIEQHDEDGRWSFHIIAKSAGESTIQLQLMHGDHSDLETPSVDKQGAIQVKVNAPPA